VLTQFPGSEPVVLVPVTWNQVPSSRTRLEPNPGIRWEMDLESMSFRVEPDLGPVPKWTPEPEPDQFY